MCREGNYDEAYVLSGKALAIAKKDASTTSWVSASLYKLGCIRLMQNRTSEAPQVSFTVHLSSKN